MRKRVKYMGAASVATLLTATSAFAQSQAQPVGPVEQVVVTGTSIRGVAPVGSAVVSLSRDEVVNATVPDPAQLIRDLPQGSGLGNQVTSGGNNLGFAQGVDLRGLGTNATLVLFDGHRLVGQGIIDQFADPNQLPISAIQRVEVVTDGASAVYGSDAVAGVVNYILRNNYDGAEISIRDTASLYNAASVDGIWGRSWEGGNVWVGGLYEHRTTFLRDKRPYLMDDLRPFGGNDNRTVLTATNPGAVGNILVDGILYGLPATNGAVPTAAQVKALAGNTNLSDSGDYTWYQPQQDRYAVTLRAQQEFLDGRAEVRFTSTNSIRNALDHEFDTTVNIPIPSTSPYYIPGLAAKAGTSLTLQYNAHLNNMGAYPVDNRPVDRSYNNTLYARFNINDNWQLSGYYTQGNNYSCGRCGARGNTSFAQLATTNFSSIFNPYLVGPQPAFLNSYWGGGQYQTGGYSLKDAVAKLEGDLFTLPGGGVRIAVGGEFTRSSEKLVLNAYNMNITDTLVVVHNTTNKRRVSSGFAEMFIPIVGDSNSMPGIQTLNLSVAARYDNYSDFGSTTNPKVGFTYEPFSDLSLRGSWGTSFRAPTLTETNPGVVEQYNRVNYANGAGDPSIPLTSVATGTTLVLSRTGNTPGLTPETARTLSFGGDYKPSYVPGLLLSVTYYDVSYNNRIENLPNATSALANPANRQLYAPFIIVAPQPKTCVPFNFATYNPLYLPYVTRDVFASATSTANDCQLGAIILGGERNSGQLKQNGIDLKAAYQFSNEWGDFTASFNGSKILNLTKSLLPGGQLVSELDKIGFQVSERATARLSWRQGPWGAGVSANFTGPYTNNLTITVNGKQYPATHIPAWTTFGLNLSYNLPEIASGVASVASGVRLALSMENFTNEGPPIVLSGTAAFDQANANPYGRIISFDITKSF